ncbi:hypothetical protein ACTWP5_14890 [Streptomyces sp. 4N509B]|uniref:hypothetical protein n=1 Tax=Streptomyces sp. 4N509B TaxID=3457413 RepID=UPI003FD1458D
MVTKDGSGPATAHEAYAFACLSCGRGWEQEYAIQHQTDPEHPDGPPLVRYLAGGRPVPSPLTHPRCPACEGTRVRVIRSGLVAAAERATGGVARR